MLPRRMPTPRRMPADCKGFRLMAVAGVVDGVFGSIAALFHGAKGRFNALVDSVGHDGLDAVDFAENIVDCLLACRANELCHELYPSF